MTRNFWLLGPSRRFEGLGGLLRDEHVPAQVLDLELGFVLALAELILRGLRLLLVALFFLVAF